MIGLGHRISRLGDGGNIDLHIVILALLPVSVHLLVSDPVVEVLEGELVIGSSERGVEVRHEPIKEGFVCSRGRDPLGRLVAFLALGEFASDETGSPILQETTGGEVVKGEGVGEPHWGRRGGELIAVEFGGGLDTRSGREARHLGYTHTYHLAFKSLSSPYIPTALAIPMTAPQTT